MKRFILFHYRDGFLILDTKAGLYLGKNLVDWVRKTRESRFYPWAEMKKAGIKIDCLNELDEIERNEK